VSLSLYVLPVSPWSERARWALDHHRLTYRTITHVPFLGEKRLRKVVGPDKPKATVPVLVGGEGTLTESWDIAAFADRTGGGAKLIPADREAEIRDWNRRADETMSAARGLVTAGMLASPAALDENAPPAIPRFLRPLARPVARRALRWFAKKHGVDPTDTAKPRAAMRELLAEVRRELAGRPYLCGGFSYADIVMASCLQGIAPVADEYIALGPATRQVWTQPELGTEFSDLVAWRDRLYAEHRRPR
jgi:glutathione S-transferase